MKEYLKPTQPEIVWPQKEIVEVPSSVDFIYIMRRDVDFTITPIVNSLSKDSGLGYDAIKRALATEYNLFIDKTAQCLLSGFSPKGLVQIHMYEDSFLANKIKEKTKGYPIVSLDPLYSDKVMSFKVSRSYYLGGTNSIGQVSRPGSNSLENQAAEIAKIIGQFPVYLVEDDVFSGGSLGEAINNLRKAGIKIYKSVPGIQVGIPSEIYKMGITVDPAVKYVTTDNVDIFSKVDLGDPRDFLIGADGLVVKLPSGNLARAPYILPFVSTSARAGIVNEEEFGLQILDINLSFYKSLEQKIGGQVALKYLNPYFQSLMINLYGAKPQTPIVDVIAWAKKNYNEVWTLTKDIGNKQKWLEE